MAPCCMRSICNRCSPASTSRVRTVTTPESVISAFIADVQHCRTTRDGRALKVARQGTITRSPTTLACIAACPKLQLVASPQVLRANGRPDAGRPRSPLPHRSAIEAKPSDAQQRIRHRAVQPPPESLINCWPIPAYLDAKSPDYWHVCTLEPKSLAFTSLHVPCYSFCRELTENGDWKQTKKGLPVATEGSDGGSFRGKFKALLREKSGTTTSCTQT